MKSRYGVRILAASFALMFTLSACGGGQEQSADVEFAPEPETLSVEQAAESVDTGGTESEPEPEETPDESGAAYEAGYAAGEAAGYAQGYKVGYDEGGGAGYDNGYAAGQKAGYEEGYAAGEAAGYKQGYKSGYDEGGGIGYDNGYAAGQKAASKSFSSSGSSSSKSSGGGGGAGDADRFNTYDNASQQETTAAYVLNTSSKKVHKPSCSQVKKISPANYKTSDSDPAGKNGWTHCKVCFK